MDTEHNKLKVNLFPKKVTKEMTPDHKLKQKPKNLDYLVLTKKKVYNDLGPFYTLWANRTISEQCAPLCIFSKNTLTKA